MRLYKLIGLELNALQKEHGETLKNIARYNDILNNYESMARVIIDELEGYRKEYGATRKTQIMNAEAVVLEEKKAEAFPAVFLMDRFGYARGVDESVYEKNREAADAENRIVIHCMSDAKLCVFTDIGRMHILNMEDVPHGKFRDKGIPIDNLSGYDSKDEAFICVMPAGDLVGMRLMFVTLQGSAKQVEGTEFQTSRRTIAATKLDEGDRLVSVHLVHIDTPMVLHTQDGYMLKIPEDAIPVQKKTARGVRAIRLSEGDTVRDVYYLEEGAKTEIDLDGRTVYLSRLKTGTRDSRGTKQKK